MPTPRKKRRYEQTAVVPMSVQQMDRAEDRDQAMIIADSLLAIEQACRRIRQAITLRWLGERRAQSPDGGEHPPTMPRA